MKMLIKKIIALIIILSILLFTLAGCGDADGVENLAYVTAIGFDISENDIMTLTFQFAKLISTDQSGSSQPQSSELVTIDCSSFDSGLAIVNSYISKKVSLSHCKIIIFSEAFAVNGISKELNTLAANTEVRPDCNVFISKCLAKDLLENSIPTLTNLTPRFFEILVNSKEYTGFSDNTPLWKFYINLKSDNIDATTVLCGLNDTYLNSSNNSNLMEKDVNYKAGEAPLTGKTLSENMGLAVFSQDRLIGELSGIECIAYLILSNSLETCNISIPDPFTNNSTLNIKLELRKRTNNDVNLVNNSPYIYSKVYLRGYITSMNLNSDTSKVDHINTIEKYAESYIQSILSQFLYKTSKEFGADIVGFGKKVVPKYLKLSDWKSINWNSLYKNSFFNVDVDVLIQASSLSIKE